MKTLKILIAEDESMLSEFYQEFLEDYFSQFFEIQFDIYDNGMEALNTSFNEKYDLIISDVNMPYMNGLDFTKKLKSASNPNSETPLILITAVPQALNFTQDNLCYVMKKPMDPSRFEKVCKIILAEDIKAAQKAA
ncbi:response regulator [Halobacteriovorax sp. GB3]|uniref:response regulator n=1 Tax=Halobacteriovorax sp. GB3 TaxID=2719615 RepID=UPI0023630C3C|nr:response regulator [Halobacteriovorax sp. GB3]MDD0852936.1 response regulator [Halobacteriovorax sp. GB3]